MKIRTANQAVKAFLGLGLIFALSGCRLELSAPGDNGLSQTSCSMGLQTPASAASPSVIFGAGQEVAISFRVTETADLAAVRVFLKALTPVPSGALAQVRARLHREQRVDVGGEPPTFGAPDLGTDGPSGLSVTGLVAASYSQVALPLEGRLVSGGKYWISLRTEVASANTVFIPSIQWEGLAPGLSLGGRLGNLTDLKMWSRPSAAAGWTEVSAGVVAGLGFALFCQ